MNRTAGGMKKSIQCRRLNGGYTLRFFLNNIKKTIFFVKTKTILWKFIQKWLWK